MIISVRLFARAKDLAGAGALTIDLPPEATVGQLKRRLAEEQPKLSGILERSAVAVNEEFADDETVLRAGAEVALLPPVSGGCE
jgi:molybdopterin converting factor subunit 1